MGLLNLIFQAIHVAAFLRIVSSTAWGVGWVNIILTEEITENVISGGANLLDLWILSGHT